MIDLDDLHMWIDLLHKLKRRNKSITQSEIKLITSSSDEQASEHFSPVAMIIRDSRYILPNTVLKDHCVIADPNIKGCLDGKDSSPIKNGKFPAYCPGSADSYYRNSTPLLLRKIPYVPFLGESTTRHEVQSMEIAWRTFC